MSGYCASYNVGFHKSLPLRCTCDVEVMLKVLYRCTAHSEGLGCQVGDIGDIFPME